MKNTIFKLLVLVLFVQFFKSCDSEDNSNMWSSIDVMFYDNQGNDLTGEKLELKINDYLNKLRIKVTSENYDENIEVMYYNDELGNQIQVPLKLNSIFFKNETENSDYEIFEYSLLQENVVVFNEKFRLKYREGNPFEVVTEMSNLDSKGEWKEYKPKKSEIIINGKNTGVFFSVETRYIDKN
ncbi:hypothetical protein [Tenacibaculum dicentrarchi]|uniref:hypothetical protein n=1 Tax=Tenacibaculum dicentrarchi TaxID=669041 RepID=UPI000C7C026C|nr:hypothetical protein TDCHD05_40195 [Tenacibaculum dicentrarchi]